MKFFLPRASVLLALATAVWANNVTPGMTKFASNSRQGSPAILPATTSSDTHGNALHILCQINRDRYSRYLSPIFLHQTLSDVAQQLGDKFTAGVSDTTDTYDMLFYRKIAPLGNAITSSYKILGTLSSDTDFVTQIEQSIYSALFARNLDAIGLYEDGGVYTIVLASGLLQKPRYVQSCPSNPTQFTPTPNDGPPAPDGTVNGVNLPQFLCAINRERIAANAPAFVVHTALAAESVEQVKVMNQLGHYTVTGPRYVDEAIYGQHVNVVKLYWMAGEGYRGANSLANLLLSNYRSTLLDPAYTSIGVAQGSGFWSVIMASQSRAPSPGITCPVTTDDITYIS
ncbi:hypothetical protein IWW38_002895 [Coemansia aciculifera]|uniref:Uncharacterized protein n=1 Tax=Coemansia aciculifera TaxID=417176 RepID=A0ACC1M259_9FUNG|nr:hypothetical protein IWW38_002895 [Coemansia aciculifera]